MKTAVVVVKTHGNGVKIGCHVTKKKSESVSKRVRLSLSSRCLVLGMVLLCFDDERWFDRCEAGLIT